MRRWGGVFRLLAKALLLIGAEALVQQTALRQAAVAAPPAPPNATETVPAPTSDSPAVPPPSSTFPIDLSTALRLAEAENPTIAEARTAIAAALALQQGARALLLPTLNAGMNYHGHVGNLQRSSGRILNLSEQSLYFGGGARTLAAETVAIPAVNIMSPITDALFEPLAARQRLTGAQFDSRATANAVLLEVALLHFDLLAANAALEAQRLSESQYYEIVRITGEFVLAGQGRSADGARAESDWRLQHAKVQRAEEEVAVASARLALRLNLDQSVRLIPRAGALEPIDLIDVDVPARDLVRAALRRRPELGSRSAAIAFAETRQREEAYRPLLPTLWVGFSGGAFGGGSNLKPPDVGHFAGRTDFDVRAYWTLLNFGIGNLSRVKQRRAELGQAIALQSRIINQIRDEVTSAHADALAARHRIDAARRALRAAEIGFQQDLERSRQNLGRPIEVLNNLSLLAQARLSVIRAITDYNEGQMRLFVALGSPPPLDPAAPSPDAQPPIATPLHSPICVEKH
jgi:outer membrane protein TolC